MNRFSGSSSSSTNSDPFCVVVGLPTAVQLDTNSTNGTRDAHKRNLRTQQQQTGGTFLEESSIVFQPRSDPSKYVLCVPPPQDASAGSNGLLSGWGASMVGGASSGKDGASKWEQSKQKGDLGYYFAHHITMKELAPEDYRMNGPRLLSKVSHRSKAFTGASAPRAERGG